jgi:hypothetical protein
MKKNSILGKRMPEIILKEDYNIEKYIKTSLSLEKYIK